MKFDDIKDKITKSKFGQFFGKLNKRTRILIIAGAIAVIAVAVIVALVLNQKDYVVLFSNVTEEEATQIVAKLQESGVDFQYKGGGTIMVDETVADQTRANLAFEGYPKSGFTYDVFTEHAGGMTTDTEKQTYKLYELQNRIGATVMLFDGVKDAKVTIALKEEQKYALEDKAEDKEDAGSASVVVTMEDGGSPSSKQAGAIQRLVAKSVPGMKMENVAVFDGNGLDVSANTGGSGTSGTTGEEIAQLIEEQITKKVVNVLGPFYGGENIRVSAKGQVNMERVVRENTTYRTPEKIDENDKTGIVSNESINNEESAGGANTGGVAGTENNADIPQYGNAAGNGENTYTNNSRVREYLVNQIKEQGELDPGVLEDLTVSIAINGNTLGTLTEADARSLVANATGITQANQNEKITIVAAPFYKTGAAAQPAGNFFQQNWLILAISLLALLVLATLIILLAKRKKRAKAEELLQEEESFVPVMPEPGEDVHDMENPEILNLKNEKTRALRESVREFADQNPEISAQMIKNWLNGGGADGGKTNGQ